MMNKPNMMFVKSSQERFEARIIEKHGVFVTSSSSGDTTEYYLNKDMIGEWTKNGFQGMGFWNGWYSNDS